MATLEAVAPVVRSFRAHPSSLYQVLLLAVLEACVNAVLHSSSRTVRVAWRNSAGCAEVVVQDEGIFNRRLPMPELDGPSGRGILLMMAVMDEVTIHEGTNRSPGTQVRLRKCHLMD